MRCATRSQALGAALTLALLLALGGPARAEEPAAQDELRTRRSREILAHTEKGDSKADRDRADLHTREKHGVEYSYSLPMGRRDLVFSVYAPIVSKKRLGLGLELRF